jgi:hypothetical protein
MRACVCVRHDEKWANCRVYLVMSGFRLMGSAQQERSNANHSCRSEHQDPQRSQINSPLCPVAPGAHPPTHPVNPPPPGGKILLYTYTVHSMHYGCLGLGWLGRCSHTWACAAGIHACAAGISLAPVPPPGVSGFRLEKLTSPTPITGSANGRAGWGGKGVQFPGPAEFSPTIHAADPQANLISNGIHQSMALVSLTTGQWEQNDKSDEQAKIPQASRRNPSRFATACACTNWPPCGTAAAGTERAQSLGDMFRPFLPATQRPRVLLPHLQCTPAWVCKSGARSGSVSSLWRPLRIGKTSYALFQTELVLGESTCQWQTYTDPNPGDVDPSATDQPPPMCAGTISECQTVAQLEHAVMSGNISRIRRDVVTPC